MEHIVRMVQALSSGTHLTQASDTNGQFLASSLDIMELEPNHRTHVLEPNHGTQTLEPNLGTQTLRRRSLTQDTDKNGLNLEVTTKMTRDKSPESDNSMDWQTPHTGRQRNKLANPRVHQHRQPKQRQSAEK